MKISASDFKKFKEVEDDLINRLILEVSSVFDAERCALDDDVYFEHLGINYGLVLIESEPWEDDGKYAYSSDIYQLVSFDGTKNGYPTLENITVHFNMFVKVNVSRTGSYFSYYDYYYDDLCFYKGDIYFVPEVVIPAHEEVNLVKL